MGSMQELERDERGEPAGRGEKRMWERHEVLICERHGPVASGCGGRLRGTKHIVFGLRHQQLSSFLILISPSSVGPSLVPSLIRHPAHARRMSALPSFMHRC